MTGDDDSADSALGDSAYFAEYVRVSRWGIAPVATALLVALGVATGRPELLVAGVIPLVYLAVSTATSVSEADVVVSRSVDPERPMPGEDVTVTLAVENVGSSVLTDVRIVDGVPPGLAVVDGSPRAGIGLRPDCSTTIEYTVVAKRGTHQFAPPRIRVRSTTGSSVYTGHAEQTGTTELHCVLAIEELPLQQHTGELFGQLPTDTPGDGLEFHSTREYRPGDRLSRINWRRYAETGALTTTEFRETRSTTVVFVLDARPPAAVGTSAGQPSAVEYGLYAIDRAISPLQEAGNRVGITVFGRPFEWSEPTRSREIDRRVAKVAEMIGTETSAPVSDGGSSKARSTAQVLCRKLPADAQVVLVSPVVDDFPVKTTQVFRAYGHPVTVLSPDPTSRETPGQRLERLDRRVRLIELRERGAKIVDWDTDEPLSIALGDTLERWIDR